MTIAAHQPNFLPNLAFFDKMHAADLFVVISNLQFEKQEGWQQRHKIPVANSEIWLTVPVLGSQNQRIKEVKINNQLNWKKKHARTLETVYSKTAEKKILNQLLALYQNDWQKLSDLNFAFIKLLAEILEIKTPIVLDEEVSGQKHRLLINICKKYKADAYLSGVGAKDYLDQEKLNQIAAENINHLYVRKNLTAMYPYTTVHYLLKEGRGWVLNVING